MMNKKETPRLGLAKYVLVLPVIAALLSFNICDATVKAAVSETETVTVTAPETGTVASVPEKAQVKETPPPPPISKETSPTDAKRAVYHEVQQMPKFPGGDAALFKWLKDNISYPATEMKDSIQGVVTVRFIIRPDGSADDFQIVQSLTPACDQEVIRVLKRMQKWIPGKQDGEAVSVYLTLPVKFSL